MSPVAIWRITIYAYHSIPIQNQWWLRFKCEKVNVDTQRIATEKNLWHPNSSSTTNNKYSNWCEWPSAPSQFPSNILMFQTVQIALFIISRVCPTTDMWCTSRRIHYDNLPSSHRSPQLSHQLGFLAKAIVRVESN